MCDIPLKFSDLVFKGSVHTERYNTLTSPQWLVLKEPGLSVRHSSSKWLKSSSYLPPRLTKRASSYGRICIYFSIHQIRYAAMKVLSRPESPETLRTQYEAHIFLSFARSLALVVQIMSTDHISYDKQGICTKIRQDSRISSHTRPVTQENPNNRARMQPSTRGSA